MCDEVQAGFGRTGTMWGFEHYGIVPDLTTFGKGISSSLPHVGGGRARRTSWTCIPPGSMTSTHTGNPVCCAAALASHRPGREGEPGRRTRARMGDVLHAAAARP